MERLRKKEGKALWGVAPDGAPPPEPSLLLGALRGGPDSDPARGRNDVKGAPLPYHSHYRCLYCSHPACFPAAPLPRSGPCGSSGVDGATPARALSARASLPPRFISAAVSLTSEVLRSLKKPFVIRLYDCSPLRRAPPPQAR